MNRILQILLLGGLLGIAVSSDAGDYDVVFSQVQRMLGQSLKNDEAGLQASQRQLEGVPRPAQQNGKEARALNQQGLDALQRKDYPAAVVAFQQAQQANPADVEIAANLGYANLKLNLLKRAEHQLVYAISLAPARTSSWYNLGEVYGAMDESDKAVGAFANSYRFSQNRVKTEAFIRQALVAPENSEPTRAALRRALHLFGLSP